MGRVFAHIDGKIDDRPFIDVCEGIENVEFVPSRRSTYWGDFSYVSAEVETMRHALSLTNDSVDRFVVVQGSDYPIVPFDQILSFFDTARGVNFINACVVEDCDSGEMNKYRIPHDLKDRSFHMPRTLVKTQVGPPLGLSRRRAEGRACISGPGTPNRNRRPAEGAQSVGSFRSADTGLPAGPHFA